MAGGAAGKAGAEETVVLPFEGGFVGGSGAQPGDNSSTTSAAAIGRNDQENRTIEPDFQLLMPRMGSGGSIQRRGIGVNDGTGERLTG